MFIFSENEQIKKEFKKIVIDEGLTMVEVANRCDLIPQQLNNKFNNNRIAFTDLKQFLNSIGYELQIEFIKKEL
jgi:predicted transcriptional regulator